MKCFYLCIDQCWLKQIHCLYVPKIRAECRQSLSLTPPQSPFLQLLRNGEWGRLSIGFVFAQFKFFKFFLVGNIRMFIFKRATGPDNGQPIHLFIREWLEKAALLFLPTTLAFPRKHWALLFDGTEQESINSSWERRRQICSHVCSFNF